MQVLCKSSQTSPDVHCPVCGEGFQLFWERTSRTERSQTLKKILQALAVHHDTVTATPGPHPAEAFNIPSWSGQPHFSGAALLGGFPEFAR
jgi:hypothetical protein